MMRSSTRAAAIASTPLCEEHAAVAEGLQPRIVEAEVFLQDHGVVLAEQWRGKRRQLGNAEN
jgi:hypothetical protein